MFEELQFGKAPMTALATALPRAASSIETMAMISRMIRLLAASVTLVFSPVFSPAWAQDGAALERQGRALLADKCARCHAIDRAGDSPHREAPPFRILGQRYPIDSLAESLAEGLSTGHRDMPEFMFEVDDVDAILAYLKSIQQRPAAQP
jgi:mono/diheme cytochrome c family protein